MVTKIEMQKKTIKLVCENKKDESKEYSMEQSDFINKERNICRFLRGDILQFLNKELEEKGLLATNVSFRKTPKTWKSLNVTLEYCEDFFPVMFDVIKKPKYDEKDKAVVIMLFNHKESHKTEMKMTEPFGETLKKSNKEVEDFHSFKYNGVTIELDQYPFQFIGKLPKQFTIKAENGKESVTKSGLDTFANLERYTEKKFDKTAPKWRLMRKGPHPIAVCKNPDCKAYKQEVITFFDGHVFNFNEDKFRCVCPICNNKVQPYSFYFSRCVYEIVGRKVKEGEVVNFESKLQFCYEDVRIFEPDKSEEQCQWVNFIITWNFLPKPDPYPDPVLILLPDTESSKKPNENILYEDRNERKDTSPSSDDDDDTPANALDLRIAYINSEY